MSTTPHLGLPLLAAAQAQKHVTHNEALAALDALVQCAVLDKDLVDPPASPAEGDRYIVPSAATGAWAGKSGSIVFRQDGAWLTVVPRVGFMAYVVDEALLYVFTSGGWTAITNALTAIQNLGRLGLGTVADATTPFSAKLNKALWAARTVAEAGTGDLRYTLNKETAANVLSLLFQTGYSGRLELGLVGSDNLAAKVSADGTTWRQALSIDAATGSVDFLSGEVTVASAATVDLGAQTTRRVAITGTTTIISFGTGANKERLVRFTGALTLTHNAGSLVLPGGANIATAAGDAAHLASDASGNWRVLNYRIASRGALPPVATTTAQGEMSAADKAKLNGLGLGANLAENGDFETGLDGWAFTPNGVAGASASIVANASDGFSGAQYAVVDIGTTGPVGANPYLQRSDAKPIEGGAWHSFTMRVRADAAAPAFSVLARLSWLKSNGAAVTGVHTLGPLLPGTVGFGSATLDLRAPALTTAWQTMGGAFKAPDDAAFVRVAIYVMGGTTTARYHQFDAVNLRACAGPVGIEPKAVGNVHLADMAAAGLKGATAAGGVADLTASQARTLLGLAIGDSPTFAGLVATGPIRVPSYTVAGLPAAGTAGRIAYASNGRAFNGAGVQEGAGAGTGTQVTDNGSAWKIAGTNVTVTA